MLNGGTAEIEKETLAKSNDRICQSLARVRLLFSFSWSLQTTLQLPTITSCGLASLYNLLIWTNSICPLTYFTFTLEGDFYLNGDPIDIYMIRWSNEYIFNSSQKPCIIGTLFHEWINSCQLVFDHFHHVSSFIGAFFCTYEEEAVFCAGNRTRAKWILHERVVPVQVTLRDWRELGGKAKLYLTFPSLEFWDILSIANPFQKRLVPVQVTLKTKENLGEAKL